MSLFFVHFNKDFYSFKDILNMCPLSTDSIFFKNKKEIHNQKGRLDPSKEKEKSLAGQGWAEV